MKKYLFNTVCGVMTVPVGMTFIIENKIIQRICDIHSRREKMDVLKIGHHGIEHREKLIKRKESPMKNPVGQGDKSAEHHRILEIRR